MYVPKLPMLDQAVDWFKGYCQSLEIRQGQKKDILEDNSFINWLNVQLNNTPEVKINIDADGMGNGLNNGVSRLGALYDVVRQYADENYIISLLVDGEISYLVSFNDNVIQIGYCGGEEPYFFARKVKKDEVNVIIPYEKIKGYFLTGINAETRQELINLQNMIRQLKMIGITDDEIIYTTAKELKYVK